MCVRGTLLVINAAEAKAVTFIMHETECTDQVLYTSVSQPPGRGSVPGPGINYTGPREA